MTYFSQSEFVKTFQCHSIAKKVSTPLYIYNADIILKSLEVLKKNLAAQIPQNLLIRYAVKANTNHAILGLLAKQGIGAEVVSGGELWRALKAGIPSEKIVFSGVGKTLSEIETALDHNIEQLSIESIEELHFLANLSRPANISLRISPDIDAMTHNKITTGRWSDKFGMPLDQLPSAFAILQNNPFLQFLGFSVHLGSQISDVNTYRQAFRLLNALRSNVPGGLTVKRLDLGGGFFVPYHSDQSPFDWHTYANVIKSEFNSFPGDIVIEPGRFLVAQAGILLTKILYIKKTKKKTFVVVDAGMNDMMRTALYDMSHPIISCEDMNTDKTQTVDVVGPVCETSDTFAKDIILPASLKQGDLLAITHTGAYGASLSSLYNSRPFIGEVLIENQKPYLVRQAVLAHHMSAFDTYRELT